MKQQEKSIQLDRQEVFSSLYSFRSSNYGSTRVVYAKGSLLRVRAPTRAAVGEQFSPYGISAPANIDRVAWVNERH